MIANANLYQRLNSNNSKLEGSLFNEEENYS